MKNKNIQKSLFSLVILLSICCCIFLNTLTASDSDLNSEVKKEQMDTEELTLKTETTLSDVKIAKTVVELIKNMAPQFSE